MIAFGTKKGTGTMELAGVKLKSNEESEPERKEARGGGSNRFAARNARNDHCYHMDCHRGNHCIPEGIGVERQKEE